MMFGLHYCLGNRNFRMLRYLCKLASRNHFFTKKQLRQMYDTLRYHEGTHSMTHHEYQVFLFEMDGIKKLLIDRPFDASQMTITIKTGISSDDMDSAAAVLAVINKAIETYAPQASTHVTMRHNSPFIFEIFSSDSVTTLYNLLVQLSIVFYGETILLSPVITEITKTVLKGMDLLTEAAKLTRVLIDKRNPAEPDHGLTIHPVESGGSNGSLVRISDKGITVGFPQTLLSGINGTLKIVKKKMRIFFFIQTEETSVSVEIRDGVIQHNL